MPVQWNHEAREYPRGCGRVTELYWVCWVKNRSGRVSSGCHVVPCVVPTPPLPLYFLLYVRSKGELVLTLQMDKTVDSCFALLSGIKRPSTCSGKRVPCKGSVGKDVLWEIPFSYEESFGVGSCRSECSKCDVRTRVLRLLFCSVWETGIGCSLPCACWMLELFRTKKRQQHRC